MEFEGRIQRVLPVRSGTSQRGEWKALPFVFEYFENADQRWSDKVLLETFDTNIMTMIGVYLKKGPDGKAIIENGECVLVAELKCKIGFSHSVRSFERQDGTTAIDAGAVFREALKAGAEEIIVAHNHPSGDLTPSKADIAATGELNDLARRLGIVFLDHLLIGADKNDEFLSLAEFAGLAYL